MIDWRHHITLPETRTETHFGDRSLRCFSVRPPSFYAMLSRAVATRPEHEALACNDQRWTYQQLNAEVDRIAHGLAARGLQAGERVVMFISNRAEFVSVLFALQKLGAIAVPVGTREQGPGLAYIVQQCGAAGIVFDDDLADRVPDSATVPALRLRISTGIKGETLASLNGPAIPPATVDEAACACILYTSGTTGNPKARCSRISILRIR